MQLSSGGSRRSMNEINVVPLIDITLVLLIIFMVMTPIMQRGYDLTIPPKVTTQQPENISTDQLILILTIDGRILLNKKTIERDHLKTEIEDYIRGRAQKIVFFQAHDDLVYQQVIEALDAVRAAGGTVGLVTSKLE